MAGPQPREAARRPPVVVLRFRGGRSRSVKKQRRDKGWMDYDGKRYRVGTADPFGLLLYDPEAQSGPHGSRVNLFIVSQRRTASFVLAGGVRAIVRAVEPASANHAGAVADYVEAKEAEARTLASSSISSRRRAREATTRGRGRRWPRETHCWSCKQRLSSTNRPVCGRCGGIRCSCGACFCRRVPGLG